MEEEEERDFPPPPARGLYHADAAPDDEERTLQDAEEGDHHVELRRPIQDFVSKKKHHPASFMLDEIDDRFNAITDAAGDRGTSLPRLNPFEELHQSGFRSFNAAEPAAVTSSLPRVVDESANTGPDGERLEEVDFACCVEKYLESDVFTLLSQFETSCSTRAEEMLQRATPEAAGVFVTNSYETIRARRDSSLLKAERNTWLLMVHLYRDRLLHQATDTILENEGEQERRRVLTISQRQIKKNLHEKSRAYRESQVVVKWLQQLAKLDGVHTYRIDAGRNNTLRALQALEQEKHGAMYSDMVSSMDPDALTRQDRKLHEEDASDERLLSQMVWGLVRAGCKKEAQEFCRQSGQYWRAASLSGGLSKEPLLFSDDMTNSAYQIWQTACRAISEEADHFDRYEKAVYASMCGNVEQILPVCQSWEDNLWAHYKGLLHDTLEVHLQQQNPHSLVPVQELMPDERLRNRITDIFDRLLKSDAPHIRLSVNEAHHIVQTRLILNMEEHLLDDLASWVSTPKASEVCEPSLMRFAAHVGLFFRQVRGPHPVIDVLVEAYVRHLIRTRQTALVALYTAKLPAEHQVETYANFLRDITERDERERCLDFADRAGLNVNAITKRVVELIRISPTTVPLPPLETGHPGAGYRDSEQARTAIPYEDEAAIRAIEWLTFDPDQRIDALMHANALARKFIAADKYHALDKLLQSLPRDSINVVKRRWSVRKPSGEEDIAREYVCYHYLCSARNAYEAWAKHLQGQPVMPEAPLTTSNPPKSVLVLHKNRMRTYTADLQQWQLLGWNLAEAAMRALYAVLLFQNGWLKDLRPPTSTGQEAMTRVQELEQLRRRVIPEIFFKCLTVLFENKQYQDGVELADLLADEYHRFYQAFTQTQLRQFLALVRRSALMLEAQREAGGNLPLAADSSLRI